MEYVKKILATCLTVSMIYVAYNRYMEVSNRPAPVSEYTVTTFVPPASVVEIVSVCFAIALLLAFFIFFMIETIIASQTRKHELERYNIDKLSTRQFDTGESHLLMTTIYTLLETDSLSPGKYELSEYERMISWLGRIGLLENKDAPIPKWKGAPFSEFAKLFYELKTVD